jgi:hypothetical protein
VKDLERDDTSRLASMGASWPTWTPDSKNCLQFARFRQLWDILDPRRRLGRATTADGHNSESDLFLPRRRTAGIFSAKKWRPFQIWTAPVEGEIPANTIYRSRSGVLARWPLVIIRFG